METNAELIMVRITGEDRPGLTASVMGVLARYGVTILDIGQADIHNTLTLGLLIRVTEEYAGYVMKDLLFQATELGVNIRFYPVKKDEYEEWVDMQGKNRYILTLLGRKLSARQIAAVATVLAEQGLNIDAIKRLTGRIPLDERKENIRACIEFSVRGTPKDREAMQSELLKLSSELGMDFSFQLDNMYRRNALRTRQGERPFRTRVGTSLPPGSARAAHRTPPRHGHLRSVAAGQDGRGAPPATTAV